MNNCNIIDGKKIADSLLENISDKVKSLKERWGIIPGLAVIQVGDNEASTIYVRNKVEAAKKVGIDTSSYILPKNTPQYQLISFIKKLNKKKNIDGILIQLPLPSHIDTDLVLNYISPQKDVDGFTYENIGKLYSGESGLESCTPQGAMILIKHVLGNDLSGKKAVVLGRSRIVGRPMIAMLIRENCTVTAAHSYSRNIEAEVKSADILVSATGVPNFVKGEWLKKGCCVIDVGIIRIEKKLYGDVDFESASKVAGYITPVPGGVGPMTVACLMNNTLSACMDRIFIKCTKFKYSNINEISDHILNLVKSRKSIKRGQQDHTILREWWILLRWLKNQMLYTENFQYPVTVEKLNSNNGTNPDFLINGIGIEVTAAACKSYEKEITKQESEGNKGAFCTQPLGYLGKDVEENLAEITGEQISQKEKKNYANKNTILLIEVSSPIPLDEKEYVEVANSVKNKSSKFREVYLINPNTYIEDNALVIRLFGLS